MGIDTERITALRERIFSSWNYIDVLALAVAKAGSTHFTANLSEWTRAIFDLKEQTKDRAPELLRDIFFDRDEPFSIYSREVEGFLAVMRRSGVLISWTSGAHMTYEMPRSTKVEFVKGRNPLSKDYGSVIDEMARFIDEKLGIRS